MFNEIYNFHYKLLLHKIKFIILISLKKSTNSLLVFNIMNFHFYFDYLCFMI